MNIFQAKPHACLKAASVALLAGSLFACGGSDNSTPSQPGPSDPQPEPPADTVDLRFMVQTHTGARLSDVTVTLDEHTVQSDAHGRAEFSPPAQSSYRVLAEADGFVPQALRVSGEEDGIMPIRLVPVKQTVPVADIEAARTLSAVDLGARITFPANAFVTPDGEPAVGDATVQITPWDITSDELNAMPANGQATDAGGDAVELISAGMITVDVHNDEGDYLQLAPNTTAEIQMDLPVASINNEPLSVGSTIPMWHFDEAQGLWIEDASIMGTVVASATSPVGLAVYAEVSHFSTWNWDFKWENGGSINVECRLSDSTAIPCGIQASVTLDDGSVFNRMGSLPEGGSTIINMPNSATIDWYATSDTGLIGEKTTDMSADVIIELADPSSENLVRCELPDGNGVGCSVTLTDGTHTLTQSIPAEGATIVTGWDNLDENSELTWTAETPFPITVGGQQVIAQGSATSGVSGAVDVALSTTPIDEVAVQCLAESGVTTPCILSVSATLSDGTVFTDTDIAIQDSLPVAVPAEAVLIQWSAESDGAFSQNGQFVTMTGSVETGLAASVAVVLDETVVQGPAAQSVQVRCVNGQESSATACDVDAFLEGHRVGYVELAELQNVPVGDSVTLSFPQGLDDESEWVQVMVTGDDGSTAYTFSQYGSLTEGEMIELELQCSDTGGNGNCPQ